MPRTYKITVLCFLFIGIFVMALSCSSKKDSTDEAASDSLPTTAQTEDQKIAGIMNEAMTRLKYRDKSFIYENEFAYYRDKFTFDDYLNERKIQAAQADTLEYVDVVKVTYFGKDSAKADVEVHFKGPSGKVTVLPEEGVTLYWHEGRWIKPTVSNFVAQRQYEEIMDKAKSAAQSESGGSGK